MKAKRNNQLSRRVIHNTHRLICRQHKTHITTAAGIEHLNSVDFDSIEPIDV
jgi:hypothetical protein